MGVVLSAMAITIWAPRLRILLQPLSRVFGTHPIVAGIRARTLARGPRLARAPLVVHSNAHGGKAFDLSYSYSHQIVYMDFRGSLSTALSGDRPVRPYKLRLLVFNP